MKDPRAVANFVLDVGQSAGVEVTNLALNKIVYFLHGSQLAELGEPLVDAKIEAWQYGPVFREIYHEFKRFKNRPITDRAMKLNVQTGEKELCEYSFSDEDHVRLEKITRAYLKVGPSKLVNMSHISDGPWHSAWYYDGQTNPGMEITNEAIQDHFKTEVKH